MLPTSPSCKIKTELSNVTFIEGINSGNFTDMGHVSTFDQCKQKCCDNERCNIAFKIQDDCYGVACYSRQSCRTRPAKNANVFTPEMALMRSVQESLEQSKYSCYLYLFYFWLPLVKLFPLFFINLILRRTSSYYFDGNLSGFDVDFISTLSNKELLDKRENIFWRQRKLFSRRIILSD